MSITEKEEYATQEEVIAWARKKIKELEQELKIIKAILAQFEAGYLEGPPNPSEHVEEYKIGKRLIAKLYLGDTYVRMVPSFEASLPQDVEELLKTFIEELRERQAKTQGQATANYKPVILPDGRLREIRIENLNNTVEKLKAKATLKYVAELLYRIYKSAGKEQEEF